MMVVELLYDKRQTNEELDKEIDDSSCEDSTDSLRLQCKYNGLCNYGTKGQLLMRLQKLKEFELSYYIICRYTDLKASELVIEVDPELDGEPLSDSDYDGCYQNRGNVYLIKQ